MALSLVEPITLLAVIPSTLAVFNDHLYLKPPAMPPPACNSTSCHQSNEDNKTERSSWGDFLPNASFEITHFGLNLPGVLEESDSQDNVTLNVIDLDVLDKAVINEANKRQFKIFAPTFACICVLLTMGVLGNIIALTVYTKQLKKAIARQFIMTLAISDLITSLVAMPSELHLMQASFSFDIPWLCKTIRFIAYMVNNASSFTLLAIAIERYRIICKPYKRKISAKIARRICYLNVVLAVIGSLPMAFIYGTQTIPLTKIPLNSTISYTSGQDAAVENHTSIVQVLEPSGNMHTVYGKSCMMDDNISGSLFPFYMVSVYIGGIISMFLVLIVLYGLVICSLTKRRKESMSQQDCTQRRSSLNRVRHVTFTVIVLTVLYEICYLPCLVTVCIRLVNPEWYGTLSDGGKILFHFCLKSYLLCSALNPCVYCFCNKEFLDGLRALLTPLKVSLPQKRKHTKVNLNECDASC